MRQSLHALLLLSLASCIAQRTLARAERTVIVNVVSACPVRSIIGASVEIRASDGRVISQSKTGVDGAARFSLNNIENGTLMIICHDDFFCGVIRLSQEDDVTRYFIALAPVMIADSDATRSNDRERQFT
jgi:hypothetical protein